MNALEGIRRKRISTRVEQLPHDAENHSDCAKSKEQMRPFRIKAEQLMARMERRSRPARRTAAACPPANHASPAAHGILFVSGG